MKRVFSTIGNFGTVGLLAVGIAMAQAIPVPGPAGPGGFGHRGQMLQRFAQALNLTDDQKAQAKSIFQDARQSAQPIMKQLMEERAALRDAAKAGKSDAEIDQLSTQVGTLSGQLAAIHSKAFEKFYALLTPEQRAKADSLQAQMKQRFLSRHPKQS